MAALVVEGMEARQLKFEIVNGVSNARDPLLQRRTTDQLHYEPQSHTDGRQAPGFRDLASLSEADGLSYVGGLFAANPLPPAGGPQ